MKLATKQSTIEDSLREYSALREESKRIKSRMDVLSADIKAYVQEHGVKDDKGSYYLENDEFIFGSQARKSVSFNDTAVEFLSERGFDDCLKTVVSVDEEGVEKRLADGSITLEDMQNITTTKTTYAIDVKARQSLVEVEKAKVPLAASRKYRAKRLGK